jgi:hypothetical protein
MVPARYQPPGVAARLWAPRISTDSDVMTSVTTDSVRPRERAEFWADLVTRNVTPVRIEPSGGRRLHGEITTRMLGDLAISDVSGMGVRAFHTASHVGRARSHLYAACVHLDGEAGSLEAVPPSTYDRVTSSSPTPETSSPSVSSGPGGIC